MSAGHLPLPVSSVLLGDKSTPADDIMSLILALLSASDQTWLVESVCEQLGFERYDILDRQLGWKFDGDVLSAWAMGENLAGQKVHLLSPLHPFLDGSVDTRQLIVFLVHMRRCCPLICILSANDQLKPSRGDVAVPPGINVTCNGPIMHLHSITDRISDALMNCMSILWVPFAVI